MGENYYAFAGTDGIVAKLPPRAGTYYFPRGASPITINSPYQYTDFGCESISTPTEVYLAYENDPEITGYENNYTFPLTINYTLPSTTP